MPWWDRRSAMDVDVVSGMFMLARREVLDRVGFLDEAYFVYGEEADWCYRMSRAGLKRHFWPGARILHLEGGGKSTSQRSVAMYVQMQRSLLIFFRKNYGLASELMLRLSYIPRMVVRLLGGTARMAMGKLSGKRICQQSVAALALHAGESVSRHLRSGATS